MSATMKIPKKCFVSIISILLLTWLLSSCAESDNQCDRCNGSSGSWQTPNRVDGLFMRAAIDGHPWTAWIDRASFTSMTGEAAKIEGVDTTLFGRISLQLPEKPTINQIYALTISRQTGQPTALYAFDPPGDALILYESATGYVVITNIDHDRHIIEGRFSFTATSSHTPAPITIEHGNFKLAMF